MLIYLADYMILGDKNNYISKGGFAAPVMYLKDNLKKIEEMSENTDI